MYDTFRGRGFRGALCGILILALTVLPAALTAGERRGAIVLVRDNNGKSVEGELIAVKQNAIIVLESSSASDVSLELSEIDTVRIVKKAKVLKGIGIGFAAGAGTGAVVGFASGNDEPGGFFNFTAGEKALIVGAALGTVGVILGAIFGAVAGSDQTLAVSGTFGSKRAGVLAFLSQKARVQGIQ